MATPEVALPPGFELDSQPAALPEGFTLDVAPPPGFVLDSASAPPPDSLLDQGAGVVRSFQRGTQSALRAVDVLGELRDQRVPTMRQGRRAFEQAMADPRYNAQLAEASRLELEDPAAGAKRAAKAEELFGPTAKLEQIRRPIVTEQEARRFDIAQGGEKVAAIPQSQAMQRWAKADNSNWWQVFASDPVEIIANIAAESLPQSMAGLAAGAALGSQAGPAGTAVGVGVGSFATEYANSILQGAADAGFDMSKPEAVKAFFASPKALGEAKDHALKRGVPIAVLDAVSAGLAGKFIAPALGKGVRPVVSGVAKEVGVQAAAGGTGEALAQAASGEKFAPKEIFAEIVGELAGGPAEVATNIQAERARTRVTPGDGQVIQPEPVTQPPAGFKLDPVPEKGSPTAERGTRNAERQPPVTPDVTPPPEAKVELTPEKLAELQAAMRGQQVSGQRSAGSAPKAEAAPAPAESRPLKAESSSAIRLQAITEEGTPGAELQLLPLDEDVFNTYLRRRNPAIQTLEEYRTAYPQDTHLRLLKGPQDEEFRASKTGPLKELLPDGVGTKWKEIGDRRSEIGTEAPAPSAISELPTPAKPTALTPPAPAPIVSPAGPGTDSAGTALTGTQAAGQAATSLKPATEQAGAVESGASPDRSPATTFPAGRQTLGSGASRVTNGKHPRSTTTDEDGLLHELASRGLKLPFFRPDTFTRRAYNKLLEMARRNEPMTREQKDKLARFKSIWPHNYEDNFGADGEVLEAAYKAAQRAGLATELFREQAGKVGGEWDTGLDAFTDATGKTYTLREILESIPNLAEAHLARKGGAAQAAEGAHYEAQHKADVAFQRAQNRPGNGTVLVPPDDIKQGSSYTLDGVKLRVTDIEVDDAGRVVGVTLDDGKKYQTQHITAEDGNEVPALRMDEGSLKDGRAEPPDPKLDGPEDDVVYSRVDINRELNRLLDKKERTPTENARITSLQNWLGQQDLFAVETRDPAEIERERQRQADRDELERRRTRRLQGGHIETQDNLFGERQEDKSGNGLFFSKTARPSTLNSQLSTADVEKHLAEAHGAQPGGVVQVVDKPEAGWDGRAVFDKATGELLRIEVNAAQVGTTADVDRVLTHEISHIVWRDDGLQAELGKLSEAERADIAADVKRLGYEAGVRAEEQGARGIEALVEAWRGRSWFGQVVGRVLAWASEHGLKLTRRAAEFIAARAVAKTQADVIAADQFEQLVKLPGAIQAQMGDGRWEMGPDLQTPNSDLLRRGRRAVLVPPGERMAAYKITAHHGTPHQVDKFSTSKIGTGEGAQVYGWGLYFAENPAVSAEYARRLQAAVVVYNHPNYGGKHVVMRNNEVVSVHKTSEAANRARDKMRGNDYTVTLNVEPEELLDWDKPLSEQSGKVRKALETPARIASKFGYSMTEVLRMSAERRKQLEANAEAVKLFDFAGSAIYQTIASDPDNPNGSRGGQQTGAKQATELLASLGIKGIRYLDQGSRGAFEVHFLGPDGENFGVHSFATRAEAERSAANYNALPPASEELGGRQSEAKVVEKPQTYNYVIFNEDDITITHANGQPVTAAQAAAEQGNTVEVRESRVKNFEGQTDSSARAEPRTGPRPSLEEFGDSGPSITLYHASPSTDWTTPRLSRPGVFWLSPDRAAVARGYERGGQTRAFTVRLGKLADLTADEKLWRSLADIYNDDAEITSDPDRAIGYEEDQTSIVLNSSDVLAWLKRQGYESAKAYESKETGEVSFAVFSAEQATPSVDIRESKVLPDWPKILKRRDAAGTQAFALAAQVEKLKADGKMVPASLLGKQAELIADFQEATFELLSNPDWAAGIVARQEALQKKLDAGKALTADEHAELGQIEGLLESKEATADTTLRGLIESARARRSESAAARDLGGLNQRQLKERAATADANAKRLDQEITAIRARGESATKGQLAQLAEFKRQAEQAWRRLGQDRQHVLSQIKAEQAAQDEFDGLFNKRRVLEAKGEELTKAEDERLADLGVMLAVDNFDGRPIIGQKSEFQRGIPDGVWQQVGFDAGIFRETGNVQRPTSNAQLPEATVPTTPASADVALATATTLAGNDTPRTFWDSFNGWLRKFASPTPEIPLFGPESRWNVPMEKFLNAIKKAGTVAPEDAKRKVEHVLEPLMKLPRADLDPNTFQKHLRIARRIQFLEKQRDAKADALRAEIAAMEQTRAAREAIDERREALAELENTPHPDMGKLNAELAATTQALATNPQQLFKNAVLYRDFISRYELLQPKQKGHFKFPGGLTIEQIVTENARTNAAIAASPHRAAIEEALERHYRLMAEMEGELLKRGHLIPEDMRNGSYFPHQVLDYTSQHLDRIRPGTENPFRGYLRDPKGSTKAIETDYVQAIYRHVAEVLAHNIHQDAVETHIQPLDISAEVRSRVEAKANAEGRSVGKFEWRKEENLPPGYVFFDATKKLPLAPGLLLDPQTLAKALGVVLTDGDVIEQLRKMGVDVTVTPDMLQQALVAGERQPWVIPKPVAEALDGLLQREEAKAAREKTVLGHYSVKAVRLWKLDTLFAPWHFIRYTWNNTFSDVVDKWFGADPGMGRYLARAGKEVRAFYDGGEASKELRAAFEQRVLDSVTFSEVGSVAGAPGFRALQSDRQQAFARLKGAATTTLSLSRLREATFRYAKFLADLERINKGARPAYAGAYWRDVEAQDTPEAKAGYISRKTFGDYGMMSPAGERLRDQLVPFHSWTEINFRYHANLFRNLADFIRLKEFGPAVSTARAAALGISFRLAVAYGIVHLWNTIGGKMAGAWDDDDDLEATLSAADRRRFHIILGKDERGQTKVVYLASALGDVMSWLGGDNLARLTGEWMRGDIGFAQLAGDWAKDLPANLLNKVAQSTGPIGKAAFIAASGKQPFPDVTNMRSVSGKQKWLAIAETMTDREAVDVLRRAFDNEYYPRPSGEVLQQLVLQVRRRDPEQWAFYEVKAKVSDWKEAKTGKRFEAGDYTAPEAEALRNFRRAVYLGDVAAAERFYTKLLGYGYTAERLKASIRNQHPLAELAEKDRPEFVRSLSRADREQLRRALQYWERLGTLKGSEKGLFPTKATKNFTPQPGRLRNVVETFDRKSDEDVKRTAERLVESALSGRGK